MFVLYFVLWVVFNGQITWEICIFGVIIAALLCVFTCRFMDYSLQKELWIYRRLGKLLQYVFVLVKEVVRANLGTVHLIPQRPEKPSDTDSFGQCHHTDAGYNYRGVGKWGLHGALSG